MGVLIMRQVAGILLLDRKAYQELEKDNSLKPLAFACLPLFLFFLFSVPVHSIPEAVLVVISSFGSALCLLAILTSVFYASSLFFGGRPGIQSYGSLIGYSMTSLTLCVLPYPGAVAGMTWFIACLVQATWVAGRMKLLNAVLAVFIPVLVVSLSVCCGLLPYDEEMLRNSWRTPYGYGKRSGWASF
jgi:hypothetical protein